MHQKMRGPPARPRYIQQGGPGLNAAQIAALKKAYAPSAYTYPTKRGLFSQWYWTYMRASTDSVPGLGPCGVRWLDRLLLEGGTTLPCPALTWPAAHEVVHHMATVTVGD